MSSPGADRPAPVPAPTVAAPSVAALLGRRPRGRFEVVVTDPHGAPVVIRNEPLQDDGTPMPTLYWLVGPAERAAVSRLESAGGVESIREGKRSLPRLRVCRMTRKPWLL